MNTRALDPLKKLWLSTKPVPRSETTAGVARFITTQSDAKQTHDATLDVPGSLSKVTPPDLLPRATSTLTSAPSAKTSPALLRLFQKSNEHWPYLPHNVRQLHITHQVQLYNKPARDQDRLIAGVPENHLKFLIYNKRHADAIHFMGKLLKGQGPNSQHLPTGISPLFAFEYIIYGIKLGATEQILQLYDQASRQVGVPPSPKHASSTLPTPDRLRIYGHHGLTLELVRHLIKLSKKRSNVKGWHGVKVKENPKFFSETAERVYAAYASAHGFDRFESQNYEPGSDEALANPWVGVAVACLLELGRYEPALKVLSSLFDRWTRKRTRAGGARSDEGTTTPVTESWEHPNPMDALFPSLVQPAPPSLKSLNMILSSLGQQDLGNAIEFLLKVAPARLAGFQPSPRLYRVIIDELLKQQKLDEAFGVFKHAWSVERMRLGSRVPDAFIQASLKDITDSWKHSLHSSGSDELEAMAEKRLHTFTCILEVLHFLRKGAKVSTVRKAIDVALEVGLTKVAWEISIWGNGVGIFDPREGNAPNEKGEQEVETSEQTSSPQSVALALFRLYQQGSMDRTELEAKLDELGVDKGFLDDELEM